MSNLFKQLKELKSITPDAEFSSRCRQEILNTPSRNSTNQFYYQQVKRRIFEGFAFTLAVGLTALLIYLAYLSVDFMSQNGKTRVAEREPAPDLNISLENARYFKEVAPDVYIVVLGDRE